MRETGCLNHQSNTVAYHSQNTPSANAKPSGWRFACRVVIPLLSVAGIIVGALVCIVMPVLGGVFAGVSGVGLVCYVGKCIYDRQVQKVHQPMNYVGHNAQKMGGVSQSLTETGEDISNTNGVVTDQMMEVTSPSTNMMYDRKMSEGYDQLQVINKGPDNNSLRNLTYIKPLSSGASGGAVHLFMDSNGNNVVLKLIENNEDTLQNFLGNEGRIQEEVSSHVQDLLPVVCQHGIENGKTLKQLCGCDLQLDDNKQYAYILSEYIEHEKINEAMKAKKISSDEQFKSMLLDFAGKMKVASDDLGFVHNDLSRNLIMTENGSLRLIDTGLSETNHNPFQGDDKGNPVPNGKAAFNIVRDWIGVSAMVQDPFLSDMLIGNGTTLYYQQVMDQDGELHRDLFEFNLLLTYFPDIRARIIPCGDYGKAKLLDWDECISALEESCAC